MIPTTKNSRGTGFLSGNSIGTMATDIVKCADLVVFTANEKDWEPGNVERLIRAGLFKLGAVGKIEPCLELYVSNFAKRYHTCISITWLKSARRSSSKTSRPLHHPSGTSGSLDTVKSELFREVIVIESVNLSVLV